MSDSFLSRWSRRKIEVRTQEKQGITASQPADVALAQQPVIQQLSSQQDDNNSAFAQQSVDAPAPSVAPEMSLPTEADLARVKQGGDIKAFLMDKVAPELKNKAFKALFSRPEYNVMDGLDIYIDDYNKFIPLSKEDIGKMSMSKQLLSRPDLDLLKQEVTKDLPLPAVAELQDDPKVENAVTEADLSIENEPLPLPDSTIDETVRVIPDLSQDTDSKAIDINRPFES